VSVPGPSTPGLPSASRRSIGTELDLIGRRQFAGADRATQTLPSCPRRMPAREVIRTNRPERDVPTVDWSRAARMAKTSRNRPLECRSRYQVQCRWKRSARTRQTGSCWTRHGHVQTGRPLSPLGQNGESTLPMDTAENRTRASLNFPRTENSSKHGARKVPHPASSTRRMPSPWISKGTSLRRRSQQQSRSGFDSDGNFLEEWKQFGRPSGMFIDRNDNLYVADNQSDAKNNTGVKRRYQNR